MSDDDYGISISSISFHQVGSFKKTWLGVTVMDENDWWPEWENLVYHGSVLPTAEPQVNFSISIHSNIF